MGDVYTFNRQYDLAIATHDKGLKRTESDYSADLERYLDFLRKARMPEG